MFLSCRKVIINSFHSFSRLPPCSVDSGCHMSLSLAGEERRGEGRGGTKPLLYLQCVNCEEVNTTKFVSSEESNFLGFC